MKRTLPLAALGLSLVACEAPAQTYYPQPYGYGYAAPYDYGYAPPPPPIERPPFQFAPPPGFNYGAGPMGGYTANAKGERFIECDYWSGQMMMELS